MKGITHGAITAGVNSAFVAVWTRKEAHRLYDPDIEPPSLQERVKNRAPIVAAGLGFTGLSTAVAMFFDTIELSILSDRADPRPLHRQIENHHNLHSLPYVGAGLVTAHLIRHSCKDFAHWVSEQLRLPDIVSDVIDELNNIADWMIGSGAAGAVEHILADVPNMGTALRLLKPITDTNFALGWFASDSLPHNQFLQVVGGILSGAAWCITGAYSVCWQPPEKRISSYVSKLRQCDSAQGAIRQVLSDINKALSKLLKTGKEKIWNLPLFNHSPGSGTTPPGNWIKTDGLTSLFGVASFDRETLSDHGILPPELSTDLDVSSIYRKSIQWPEFDNTPLVATDPDEYKATASIFDDSEGDIHNTNTRSIFDNSPAPPHTEDLW